MTPQEARSAEGATGKHQEARSAERATGKHQRERVVIEARSWIGTPYRHQASVKGVACDCLGLVRGVWRAVIGDEPERIAAYPRDWEPGSESLLDGARRHMTEIPVDQALPGDAVLFRFRAHLPARHAAILSGTVSEPPAGFRRSTPRAAAFVHAWDAAPAVVETGLTDWWRRRLVVAFAFPGAEGGRG